MEKRAEFTRFLEEKPSFYFPAEAAAGDSEAIKDEQKRAVRGRN
jgi:hypothetical protein